MRVRIGEQPAKQHLVRARADPRHHVGRFEGCLLHFGKVVAGITVQDHTADRDRRIVRVRPDLGQIKGVETVGGRSRERHELNFQSPGRIVTIVDRRREIADMAVRVDRNRRLRLAVGEVVDALLGLEVILHPEPFMCRVHPHEGVAAVTVHMPPGTRRSAIAHQNQYLVSRLG